MDGKKIASDRVFLDFIKVVRQLTLRKDQELHLHPKFHMVN